MTKYTLNNFLNWLYCAQSTPMGYAVLVGILISLLLIGPVFFLLIETSLSKGWKKAVVLNLGVVVSDIICILAAYFGSKDLARYIETHPSLYMMGGFFVFIYGLYMFFTKPDLHLDENVDEVVPKKGYISMFFHGLILNLLNIGAIVFWFLVVSSIAIQYPDWQRFSLYMGIVLITFFSIDLIKIFIAQRVKQKLTFERVMVIRKVLGFALLVFGIIIFLKGFGIFDSVSDEIHNRIPI